MGFERTGGPTGDTGRIYESRFLGTADVDEEFARALEQLPHGEHRLFASDEAIFALYRKHYRGDPTNPRGLHANAIYKDVLAILGLTKEEIGKLSFYSTLDIPVIDHMMGVDGFFEFLDQKAGRRRVTIDVTMQEEKKHPKADLVIGELPDAVQELAAYQEAVHEYALLIASKLMPTLAQQPPKKQPPEAQAPNKKRIVVRP